MKRKYHHLVLMAVMLAAVLAAVLWGRYAPERSDLQTARIQLPPMPPVHMPSPQVLSEIDRFQKRLQRLPLSGQRGDGAVDLRLFGYRRARAFEPQATEAGVFQPSFPAYALTFAFASKQKQFCIIDGILYTAGETLPDGGHIVKIEGRRVLIEKDTVRRWVAMQAPRSPAEPKTRKEAQTASGEG